MFLVSQIFNSAQDKGIPKEKLMEQNSIHIDEQESILRQFLKIQTENLWYWELSLAIYKIAFWIYLIKQILEASIRILITE